VSHCCAKRQHWCLLSDSCMRLQRCASGQNHHRNFTLRTPTHKGRGIATPALKGVYDLKTCNRSWRLYVQHPAFVVLHHLIQPQKLTYTTVLAAFHCSMSVQTCSPDCYLASAFCDAVNLFKHCRSCRSLLSLMTMRYCPPLRLHRMLSSYRASSRLG
jgi:hypothetical protein